MPKVCLIACRCDGADGSQDLLVCRRRRSLDLLDAAEDCVFVPGVDVGRVFDVCVGLDHENPGRAVALVSGHEPVLVEVVELAKVLDGNDRLLRTGPSFDPLKED